MLHKPSREARLRGLGRIFYSMAITSRTSDENEVSMLSNLYKTSWYKSFIPELDFNENQQETISQFKRIKQLTENYNKQIIKDAKVEDQMEYVGKKEAKAELKEMTDQIAENTVIDCLEMMIKSVSF